MQRTFEIDGVIFSTGPTLEDVLTADGRDLTASEIEPESDDPQGWRYYSDVLDAKTVSYLFAYARRHPDDEFIQDRLISLQETNEIYRQRTGKDIPGYDAEYFTKTK